MPGPYTNIKSEGICRAWQIPSLFCFYYNNSDYLQKARKYRLFTGYKN